MKYKDDTEKISISDISDNLEKNPLGTILDIEQKFDKKIADVAKQVVENNNRVILLTGPSSSGKTTTCEMISDRLCEMGKKSNIISLDNFYKPRSEIPFWSDGSRNFETIEGLDIEHFKDRLSTLLSVGEADFPIFSFHIGKRLSKVNKITFDSDTFLIIEGIHALNPILHDFLEDCSVYKIYISVHSDFVDDNGFQIMPASHLRLIRRLLRDVAFRGVSIEETLSMWKKVRRGEELYIKPFRDSADIHINSTHGFEPFLYSVDIRSAVDHIEKNSQHFKLREQIMNETNHFFYISKELIPESSMIIREFLG